MSKGFLNSLLFFLAPLSYSAFFGNSLLYQLLEIFSLLSPHRIPCWLPRSLHSILDSCSLDVPNPASEISGLCSLWLHHLFLNVMSSPFLLIFWNMSSINFLKKVLRESKFINPWMFMFLFSSQILYFLWVFLLYFSFLQTSESISIGRQYTYGQCPGHT